MVINEKEVSDWMFNKTRIEMHLKEKELHRLAKELSKEYDFRKSMRYNSLLTYVSTVNVG